ncbi:MAG TPA: helix-turn-helix domain-containing protein [Salinivirga sp.]|uniref:helix-turn-helix domain-containing protein n=1 Tax=Salinivirga sp. TaxID=1970192 RepID=UPI002B49F467|nr:helix-turn-helix domain-containing protein [Salinivirga sp.]HKK60119.1 helix-turn-helix domain-containing protein [Salinivirga sp.]
MSLTERITQIQQNEGYTASQFAEKLGIQRSGLSHIYSGRNKPSIGFIQKLLTQFPRYNAEWILNGSNPMLKQHAINSDITHTQQEKDLFSGVESEAPANYRSNTEKSEQHSALKPPLVTNKTVKQIILIYEDDTFEIMHSKNAK